MSSGALEALAIAAGALGLAVVLAFLLLGLRR